MNLKKYTALTRAGILESLQFRTSTLTIVAGNLIYMMIVYFLWKSIYASAGTEVVNGMTFSDTLIYLVLATALFSFMEMYLTWEMNDRVRTGSLVLDILRPMGFRSYVFWRSSGNLVMNFIMTFLPTFIVVYFMTNGAIHLGMNLLFFVLSVMLALTITFNIDFMVSTVCLYTESVWGINIMKEVIVLLLSGATIPIAFFPEPLKTIVSYLPFQSVYNAPLTILIDHEMPPMMLLTTLLTQLFWCIVMLAASRLFWGISLRKITVNGG